MIKAGAKARGQQSSKPCPSTFRPDLYPDAHWSAYNLLIMSAIKIRGLKKSYRVYRKKEGLLASITGLFQRVIARSMP